MSVVQTYENAKVFINGVEIAPIDSIQIGYDCKCGAESDFGCHGVRNGEIFSEYYCKNCYNKE